MVVALDGKLCPFRQTGIHSYITMDRTEKAARVAAGALLRVVRDIWHDKRPRFQYGFVLAKPPTHHCTPNEALMRYRGRYDLDDLPAELQAKARAGQAIPNGYCHLNSMACAVAYLFNLPPKALGQTGPYRPRKVVIFDIDVHLGDGTESTFYSNPDVPLSFNMLHAQHKTLDIPGNLNPINLQSYWLAHRWCVEQVYHVDFHEDADDLTQGKDATLTGHPTWAPDSNASISIENIGADSPNLDARADSTSRYKRAVEAVIPSVWRWLSLSEADGDVLGDPCGANATVDVMFFVSAGFDAMMDDGFGTQHLDAAWYRWFVIVLRKQFPRVPIVFNLEGGYNPTNVVSGMENILGALSIRQGSEEWDRAYNT